MSFPLSAKSIHVVGYATHQNPKRSEIVNAIIEEGRVDSVWSTHLMMRPTSKEGLRIDLAMVIEAAEISKPDIFVVVDVFIADALSKMTDIPVRIVNLDLDEKVFQIGLALDRLEYSWKDRVFILYNKSSRAEAAAWTAYLSKSKPTMKFTTTKSDLRGAMSEAVSNKATLVVNLLDHVRDSQLGNYAYSEYIKKELSRMPVPTLGNTLDSNHNESFVVQRASFDLIEAILNGDNEVPIYSVYMNLDSLRKLHLQRSYLDIWDSIYVLER